MKSLAIFLVTALALVTFEARADADDCKCLAIAGDVAASVQAEVARADSLYVRGDFSGALAIYAKAYGTSKDSALLYAQGMAKWRLGATADARAMFEKYLAAGGNLAYRAQVEVGIGELGGRVGGAVGGAVGATGGLVGGVAGGVTGVSGDVAGGVTGTVDTGLGVAGGVTAKPKKVAKGAAIVLGVVAIAAVGAVGIHSIAAGLKDDIELDAKFDLGLGVTGVAVGVTAVYLYGLTAAAGTAGSLKCETMPAGRPMVAPMALPGGGGLAAAMTF